MNFDERVDAVRQRGFSDRQARFLTTVMLHAGMCVPRQFATFSGTAYGHTVNAFFDQLVERRVAVVCGCHHNRAELYHVRQHALYRAIGEPHSRYRRPVSTRQAIKRLARLDALVTSPTVIWFSSEAERVAFCRLMAPSLATERLPHVTVGAAPAARLRLFPDDVLCCRSRIGTSHPWLLSTVQPRAGLSRGPKALEGLNPRTGTEPARDIRLVQLGSASPACGRCATVAITCAAIVGSR